MTNETITIRIVHNEEPASELKWNSTYKVENPPCTRIKGVYKVYFYNGKKWKCKKVKV